MIDCSTCKFYTIPAHDGDIHCAINPGCSSICFNYEQAVQPNIISQAITERKRQEFLKWRLEGLEKFGIDVQIPELDSTWTIPLEIQKLCQSIMPGLILNPNAAGTSEIDVAIALTKWVEAQIKLWVTSQTLTRAARDEFDNIWKHLP